MFLPLRKRRQLWRCDEDRVLTTLGFINLYQPGLLWPVTVHLQIRAHQHCLDGDVWAVVPWPFIYHSWWKQGVSHWKGRNFNTALDIMPCNKYFSVCIERFWPYIGRFTFEKHFYWGIILTQLCSCHSDSRICTKWVWESWGRMTAGDLDSPSEHASYFLSFFTCLRLPLPLCSLHLSLHAHKGPVQFSSPSSFHLSPIVQHFVY